jgi:hypothetical protein
MLLSLCLIQFRFFSVGTHPLVQIPHCTWSWHSWHETKFCMWLLKPPRVILGLYKVFPRPEQAEADETVWIMQLDHCWLKWPWGKGQHNIEISDSPPVTALTPSKWWWFSWSKPKKESPEREEESLFYSWLSNGIVRSSEWGSWLAGVLISVCRGRSHFQCSGTTS